MGLTALEFMLGAIALFLAFRLRDLDKEHAKLKDRHSTLWTAVRGTVDKTWDLYEDRQDDGTTVLRFTKRPTPVGRVDLEVKK